MKKKKKKKVKNNWKEKQKKYINKYRNIIKKHKNNIWCPKINIKYKNINTKSCWDIKKYSTKKNSEFKYKKIKNSKVKEIVKSKKYKMMLTKKQKNILNNWLCACGIMYNKTLQYIKTEYKKNGNLLLNYYKIRKSLKIEKNEIIKKSNKNKKERIKVHMIDTAIKLVISNYKSALTNYKQGNIKHFRMRYKRKNKNNKIVTIEKEFFKNGELCKSVFGKIKYIYDKKPIKLKINSSCKIHHNIQTREYSLYVPEKVKVKKNTKKNIISLDPGIRTFMCGLTNNSVVKIGNNISGKIKKQLKRLDKINKNKQIPNKIKKKNEKIINRKIKNIVDETHWKSINYLIKNYGNILIGDMSVKGIVNNKTSKLNKMLKRIAYKLKFYKYRQRLIYKCKLHNIGMRVIDEKYTSKICSKCGWYNKNLGGNKNYKCNNCKINMDRDINGCRGIYIKQWF